MTNSAPVAERMSSAAAIDVCLKYRIALVSYEYDGEKPTGGIGTYIRNLAKMLSGRGHSVVVLTQGGNEGATADGDVTVHRVTASRHDFKKIICPIFARYHADKRFDLMESAEYGADAETISCQFPDVARVVKLHTPSFMIGQIGRLYLSRMQRTRFVLGALRRGRLRIYDRDRDEERLHALSADEITGPSQAILDKLIKEWRLPKGRLAVVPNVFEADSALLEVPVETNTNRITYLGRLEVRKGVIELARAIPTVLRYFPSARFRLIGEPTQYHGGKAITAYLDDILGSARTAVEFVGWVPYGRVPSLLAETDICVFPSVWENFPNTCLEAMSAARAVVGSISGGMAEIIDHGTTGLLVPPRNPDAIAEAILKLLQSPDLRFAAGRAARQHIASAFSPDKIAPAQEASYARAIERARNRLNNGSTYQ